MTPVLQKRLVTGLVLGGISAFTLGCSAVKFGQAGPQASKVSASAAGAGAAGADGGASGSIIQGAGPNGTDLSNAGGPAGTPSGTGNAPAADLPKLQFLGPPCQRLTDCAITFQLDKPYPYVTELDWKTNDSLFGTTAPANLSPWGKPGFPGDPTAQYVPTSGHVVFPAGTTDQTVYVRNINQQDVPISIGVVMTNCLYDTLLESCQKFFGQ